MITYRKLAGSTDVSVVIRIIDSTDGTPETGVAWNTSGIDIQYRREGAVSTAITAATLAALTTAHSDGGFLHIGNGYYRLDLPDAACAAGAAGVLIHGTVTGMVVIGCYIQLEPVPADVRQIVGAAVSATTAQLGVNVVQISGDGPAADNAESFFDGTGYAGTNNVIPTVTTVTNAVSANVTQISGDTTAADNLELAYDDTAGAVPWNGIIDQGQAQSAGATSIQLRAAAAFANDELLGATIVITGGTGIGQSRVITDYDSGTDTATVDTWTTTPSGTILYKIYATPPASGLNDIADAILDRNLATGTDSGSATVRTVRQALRALRNKWSISGTTLTVTKEDDTTASWTSELTTNASAEPVTSSDPASA